jgi:hypothetical protein
VKQESEDTDLRIAVERAWNQQEELFEPMKQEPEEPDLGIVVESSWSKHEEFGPQAAAAISALEQQLKREGKSDI